MKELKAINARRKSFYGKAAIIDAENGDKLLRSYDTFVARITRAGEFERLWSGYSRTTARHIDEFRIQNGFTALSKSDWCNLPTVRR